MIHKIVSFHSIDRCGSLSGHIIKVKLVGVALCGHGNIGIRAVDILEKLHGKISFRSIGGRGPPSGHMIKGLISWRNVLRSERSRCQRSKQS